MSMIGNPPKAFVFGKMSMIITFFGFWDFWKSQTMSKKGGIGSLALNEGGGYTVILWVQFHVAVVVR